MRSLKIETYTLSSNQPNESISIPLAVIRGVLKLLPANIVAKFEQNRDQLELLLAAIDNPESQGKILEFEDKVDDERVIFSIL